MQIEVTIEITLTEYCTKCNTNYPRSILRGVSKIFVSAIFSCNLLTGRRKGLCVRMCVNINYYKLLTSNVK